MKILVLSMLLALPVSVLSQTTVNYPLSKHQIQSQSNDSLRIQIHRNERLYLNVELTKSNFRGKTLVPFILGSVSTLPGNGGQNPDPRRSIGTQSIHLGIMGSLASINPFKGKSQINAYLEIKQYDTNGKLLRTGRLVRQSKSGRYRAAHTFDRDGFLVVKIHNFGKQRISAKTSMNTAAAFTPKDTTIFGGGNDTPGTENDEPIAWENDLDGITIVGTGTFNNNNFIASYEAAFGPSETWTAVSASSGGDGSGGGGGGGGGSSEPPSAEAKQFARELNKIQANECEALYILEHIQSDPMILPRLITVRTYVKQYLADHNMNAANTNGAAVENALKHALYNALAYCEIGAQHALEMANLHELCKGKNQNPSEAEKSMDTFNNSKGFSIATSIGCSNTNAIVTAVQNAYDNGILHDINGNPTKKK